MGKLKKKSILLSIISMFIIPLQAPAQESYIKNLSQPDRYFKITQEFYKTKEIEIIEGLEPGDEIILSDMSQWDEHGKVRLK